MIGLAAVQAKLDIENYKNEGTFFKWIDRLTQTACDSLKDAEYKLIAFPEAIGLPLLINFENLSIPPFTKGGLRGIKLVREHPQTIPQAMLISIIKNWKEIITLLPRCNFSILRALYNSNALRAYKIYNTVFSQIARKYGVYISAGSIYLPYIEEESSKGIHIADTRVKNVSYFYSPEGGCLGRIEKINLTPGSESNSKFSCGEIYNLYPHQTPYGKVGTLICYDCFHKSLVDRYDSLGVKILLQPSFNTDKWESPWWHDKSITQSQAWVRDGIRKMVQSRTNIKVGINPMLVGNFLGMSAEGMSAIVADAAIAPKEEYGYPGFLAIARTPDEEEIVAAYIEK